MVVENLERAELAEIRRACRQLFPGERAGPDFLRNLRSDTVKRAYRQRAKALHPDLRGGAPDILREGFHALNASYRLLSRYLASPLFGGEGTRRQAKVIAVGGAKGGIGKSLFAANLGVYLSSLGLKIVLVDLDLGGANLHLYLGRRTALDRNLNDFLKGRATGLEEIAVPTGYGPLLMGGDSSELGAANIHFSRKLKLLKAVRRIEADYVILDLGGDTAHNTVDFYLAADHGIVMTTRDAASYLGAYQFLKAALYRKLLRLFGPESRQWVRRDRQLELFLKDQLAESDHGKVVDIRELRERARRNTGLNRRLLEEAIETFAPHLIVNRLPPGADPGPVVEKLRGVTRRYLSRDVRYLGSLSQRQEVEQSTLLGVPEVARDPRGTAAREIRGIVRHLFLAP